MIWYDMILYDMVLYGMILCHIIGYCMIHGSILYGSVTCVPEWFGGIWFDAILYAGICYYRIGHVCYDKKKLAKTPLPTPPSDCYSSLLTKRRREESRREKGRGKNRKPATREGVAEAAQLLPFRDCRRRSRRSGGRCRTCSERCPSLSRYSAWYASIFSHHFYFPAKLVGGFTLSDLLDKPWSQVSS